jgi:hypothetical protein
LPLSFLGISGYEMRSPPKAPMLHSLRTSAWSVIFAFLLVPALAWAAADFTYSASHVTQKSPEHVLSVLTAYGNTCEKGCKYYGPDLVEFTMLKEKKTPTSWYTWSHVSTTMKQVKYFSFVQVTKNADGTFVMTTKQLDERDQAVIDELVKATNREHAPAFDTGFTKFTVTKLPDGKTKVTQSMKMSASGMLAMFRGKIESGMKKGAEVTFQNIEK